MKQKQKTVELETEEYLQALIQCKNDYEAFDRTDHIEYRKICEAIKWQYAKIEKKNNKPKGRHQY